MSELDRRIRALSPAQRALLEAKLAKQRVTSAPLSFAQEAFWILDRLEPGCPYYNEGFALVLDGAVDASTLAAALDDVVAEHPILSSVVDERDGQRVQRVEASARPRLVVREVSARAVSEAVQLGASRWATPVLEELAAEHLARPFDLERGPLLRASLLRIAPERALFLLAVSHFVADGASVRLIARDLGRAYDARRRGEAAPAPAAAPAFWALARDERARHDAGGFGPLLEGWKAHLEGASDGLELPADRPRPASSSHRGERVWFEIEERDRQRAEALARRLGVTPFAVHAAVFALLLERYTGLSDLPIGVPFAGRDAAAREVVGPLMNVLVLRFRGDPHDPLETRALRTAQLAAEGLEHQALPFELLVRALAPERSGARNPLFQVMFAYQDETASLELPGAQATLLERVHHGASQLDLTFALERGARLRGYVEFSSELFDRSRIERLVEHHRILLAAALDEPLRPGSELPLIGAAEEALLDGWNATAAPLAPETAIDVFERVSAASPDAVAVVAPDRTLTYRALDEEARRIAAWLIARGARPGDCVALMLDRGAAFVAAVLGVMKAGAAYIPIDPRHPEARTLETVAQSGARWWLTERRWAEGPSAGAVVRTPLEALLEADPGGAPCRAALGPEALAYVFYTSGSTGTPKGAMVHHRGMLNHLLAKVEDLDLRPEDVVAQNASQCFDISVWQMLAALMVGGRTWVADDALAASPELLQAADDARVTVLETVPSLLQALLAAGPPARLQHLRWMMSTGEALPVALCRAWFEAYPRIPMVNAYGPTECADDVTHHFLYEAPASDETTVPLGRPIRNMRCYVRDAHGQRLPVGIPGHVHFAGAGVGLGYLNDPERTARAFLHEPTAGDPEARTYATGDLGRLRPDGTLEFLGRIDRQVKIRGFRIELGEVEAALRDAPGVADAAVVAAPGPAKRPVLAAYVVPTLEARRAFEARRVAVWAEIFGEVYGRRQRAAEDPAIDLAVWTASETGQSFPVAQIREVLEETAERILPHLPPGGRVLEVGCGTGLLIDRLAPSAGRYVATDVVPGILEELGERLAGTACGARVELRQVAADRLGEAIEETFDLVVLNEVVQYFPGTDYLTRALDAALARVRPGGVLFLGGVRHAGLLEAFHAEVELARADGDAPLSRVAEAWRAAVQGEKELLVDPGFLEGWCHRSARDLLLELDMKDARGPREIARFRFDAVVRAEPATERVRAETVTLETLLAAGPALRAARVAEVPNLAVAAAVAAAEALARPDAGEGVVGERGQLPARGEGAGPESLTASAGLLRGQLAARGEGPWPEALRAQLRALGWAVQLRFGASPGTLEIVAHRPDVLIDVPPHGPALERRAEPVDRRLPADPELLARWREALARRLPEYMCPQAWVTLSSLPTNTNGKLDVKALPPPSFAIAVEEPSEELADPTVRALAGVLSEILGHPVGADDNFFGAGGDSVLAIHASALARRRGLAVSPRLIFEHQTARGLASALAASMPAGAAAAPSGPVPLSPFQRRLWAHPEGRRWAMLVALELEAPLEPPRIRRALEALERRHELLRLRIVERDGLPMQTFGPARWVVPLERASSIEEARRAVEENLRLEEGRAWAACLVGHTLVIGLHHLIADATTWALLLSELRGALGNAGCEDPAPASGAFARWALGEPRVEVEGARERLGSLVRERAPVSRAMALEGGRGEEALAAAFALTRGEGEALRFDVERDGRGDEHSHHLGCYTRLETVTLDAVQPHTVARETVARETVARETVARETVARETVAPETVARERSGAVSPSALLARVRRAFAAAAPSTGEAEVVLNVLGRLDRLLGPGARLLPLERSTHPVEITAWMEEGRWILEVAHDGRAAGWAARIAAALEQLAETMEAPRASAARALGVSEGEVAEVWPVTPAQHGMLSLSLAAPEQPMYVSALDCALEGPLDVEALRARWAEVTAAVDVLRSAFVWRGSEAPVQAVLRAVALPFEVVDLPPSAGPDAVEAAIAELRAQPLAPGRAPLWRVRLVRLGPERAHLIWSFHHLILDGWSVELVLRALEDRASPHRGLSFGEYARWAAAERVRAAHAAPSFEGAPTPLWPKSEPGGEPGLTFLSRLSGEASAVALLEWSRRHHLTPSAALQAAWAVAWSVLAGQARGLLGVTVSGRAGAVPEVTEIAGSLVTTLPLLFERRDEQPLAELIRETGDATSALSDAAALSLADLRRGLPHLRGGPLFEAVAVAARTELEPIPGRFGGASMGAPRITLDASSRHFPLTFRFACAARIELNASFERARLSPERAALLLEAVQVVAEGLAEGRLVTVGDASALVRALDARPSLARRRGVRLGSEPR